MTREDLFEILDIESGEEFSYFENMAALLEAEEEIGQDLILELLKEVDLNTFAEITESYFYDVMEKLPEKDVDLYNIFEGTKRTLVALSDMARKEQEEGSSYDDATSLIRLAGMIEDFHNYYSIDQSCTISNRTTGERALKTLRDAVYDNLLAQLQSHELDFELEKAKNFSLDEYIIGIGDLYDED